MSGEFLMGYPRRVPLRSAARRRVRPARRRATSVVLGVFAEFGRAVEGGDPHAQDQRLVDGPVSPIPPKTPRRRPEPPDSIGGAVQT